VAPQALNSMLPVEDSFSDKEVHTLSRIRAHQSTSEAINTCDGEKQSLLLSATSPFWFWRQIRLVEHFH